MKQHRIFVASVLAGTLWVVGMLYGQAAPESGTPVRLTVTAEPKHGNDVPVIQKNEVMVYEGKDRDQGEGDQREDGEDAERRQARLAKIPPGRTNMSTMKITNAIT